jgi:hypothetical protein
VPAKGLFDGVAFKGFRAEVVMQKGITRENLPDHVGRAISSREPGVSVVLGAGNVSFIAAGDLLGQILLQGRATLVKLHPHFATHAAVWGRVFGPLVEEGYLRIVSGDAALGAAAVGDARSVGSTSRDRWPPSWGWSGVMTLRRPSGDVTRAGPHSTRSSWPSSAT